MVQGMILNRRRFLETAFALPVGHGVAADSPPVWGGPVLDIHHHLRQEPQLDLAHMEGCGVTHAVILTRAEADSRAKALLDQHPRRFVRFSSTDLAKPGAIETLRLSLQGGATGMGELKSHVAADGPEMRRVYDLASEFRVPVLMHFQEVPQFAGEGPYNSGLSRLPALLKAYPKVDFIGHADFFWANISADVPMDTPYPQGRVRPGGVTDELLTRFPNLYGDLSANSGRNALARDPEFAASFLARHRNKLMFGSDCSCRDGRGTGQASSQPLIKGKCVARETLAALRQLTSPAVFRQLAWENGRKLLKLAA